MIMFQLHMKLVNLNLKQANMRPIGLKKNKNDNLYNCIFLQFADEISTNGRIETCNFYRQLDLPRK